MADNIYGILSSQEQIAANYENYRDKFVDSTDELVNSETFLNLLVAEMTNQDPLEPSSNTEFITQMAQFSSLQYAKDSSTYAMATYASSLVGKTATASKQDGTNYVTKTGVVTDVNKVGDSYTVTIDGTDFDISKVAVISDTDSVSGTNTQLGETIARASLMIGMYATVKARTDSGDVYDAGLISAIQVKDGELTAIINDIGYSLSDIIEVRYATEDDFDYAEEAVSSVADEVSGDDTSDSAAEAVSEETAETLEAETESEDLADLEDPDESADVYDV